MSSAKVHGSPGVPPELLAQAADLRAEYLAAKPWPHIVVRDIFPESLLDAVAWECADLAESDLITSSEDRQIKQEATSGLGLATRELLGLLDSSAFRQFLTTVTGVPDLLADPSHKFAGVHRTLSGGFTKIHRDFRVHPTTELYHRVNLLIYLNRDWPESYGGALELWPPDMSSLGRRVQPLFNTMVMWETHQGTLHGLPDAVNCPQNRMRLSVAAYYYTERAQVIEGRPRRNVGYWVARPGEDPSIGRMPWQDHLRGMTPQPIRKVIHSIRRNLRRSWRDLMFAAACSEVNGVGGAAADLRQHPQCPSKPLRR